MRNLSSGRGCVSLLCQNQDNQYCRFWARMDAMKVFAGIVRGLCLAIIGALLVAIPFAASSVKGGALGAIQEL